MFHSYSREAVTARSLGCEPEDPVAKQTESPDRGDSNLTIPCCRRFAAQAISKMFTTQVLEGHPPS
jgi:hypothetical protein